MVIGLFSLVIGEVHPPVRVATICDIHGNLPALEAVLDEIRRSGLEQIVLVCRVMMSEEV